MKKQILSILALTSLLTNAQPILAQDGTTSMKLEPTGASSLSDLNLRVNPQLGLSNFEHSGKSGSTNNAAFGATVEAGQPARKLETGLMIITLGSDTANTQYLAIPLMAKFRIMQGKAQSWYAKAGITQAFELNSSNKEATNNVDTLLGAGFGGRLALGHDMDFIVEGTYNRGLLDNLKGGGDNRNQGFLVLAGISLKI